MKFYEIRLFSRGGQGGVSAAKLLAYAGSFEGWESQAIPKYGAERKGAPLFVDVRLADRPIRRHAPVVLEDADHFIVFESTLMDKLPKEYTKDVIIIVNSSDPPKEIPAKAKLGLVDAYKIADETGLVRSGTRLVSSTMLGAWVKATNMISLDSVEKAVRKMFSGTLADQNMNAIKLAYDQFEFVGKELVH
ncbi:MAG: 2-oxoacid:acceptor oxidoreductase family protein [Candidatus Hodarchaeales archaeon]|jgi:pyruvate ferredoxin oxidoreductase gamma subunit